MKNTVVIINSNGMGQADSGLSHKLVKTYLKLLDLGEQRPLAICLYAEGVKLAASASPVLEELEALVENGVRLVVCTTCLNHYQLMDDLKVGIAGGMKDIIEAQVEAEKVITL